MRTIISGKQFEVSERLSSHVQTKIANLEKFYDPILDCHVTLGTAAHAYKAYMLVRVQSRTLKAENIDESVYTAFDGAVEKMVRQLKKLHDKRRKIRVQAPQSTH